MTGIGYNQKAGLDEWYFTLKDGSRSDYGTRSKLEDFEETTFD